MARSALLYLLPAALVASNWLRLERPHGAGSTVAWISLLAFLPALVRSVRMRIAVGAVASLLALHTALSVSIFDARPFDGRHDFFGPLGSRFSQGFLDFYDVAAPFDPTAHPLMHGVILLAIFGFSLAIALGIAARRPLAAVLAVVVGAGWPATLLAGGNELRRGTFILAAALVLLAGLSARHGAAFARAVPVAVLVAVAAVLASSSPAVAKGEFLRWQSWDFYNHPQTPVDVSYVWDSNYGGLHWPKKVTTVLRVEAPPTSVYWRASTLDLYNGQRWVEQLAPAEPKGDPLLPAEARHGKHLIEQQVTIEALRDRHLVGGSIPVAYRASDLGTIGLATNGAAIIPAGVDRGQRYTVWSYAPEPSPTRLAASEPRYPPLLGREGYFDIEPGVAAPPFGAPARDAQVRKLFRAYGFAPVFQAELPLYEKARDVVGEPRSPYAAAVALETWFRTTGNFHYDETPPVSQTEPLIDFVLRTKRGYCQHFAGAMALMLRLEGIPARVAVGFASGTYDRDRGVWKVTDHDAHAWVEAWFRGYGWLPFDPTPGRGSLSATYTASSRHFDVDAAARMIAFGALARQKLALAVKGIDVKMYGAFGEKGAASLAGGAADVRRGARGSSGGDSQRGASLLKLLALVALVIAAAIALTKLGLRRGRFLTGDPRRVAAACRRELADFLTDQRIEVAPSATLSELAAVVQEELAVDAREFVAAATLARFGPPRPAAHAARRARRELRALERVIRSRLSHIERARGLLSLRSLGFSA